ncbi:MAG: hypothetical protein M0T84_18190 [Betaproteobacteria bacterium]|nr:hypothetical protein [Betaproteobacteria bacterium]
MVVATHDCDLAQLPEGEPLIEVIVGRAIATQGDGNCTHAKNARKLHIEFEGGASLWVEVEATAKATIAKTALAPFEPQTNAQLSPENKAIFQMWLASRYRRSAFPDEFERRLTKETKLAEKIAKTVKPHGNLITGVFFDVDDGQEVTREGPEDTYKLDIIILHTADPDFAAAEAAAKDIVAVIKKAFKDKLFNANKKWQHIELHSCEAISESVLSYQLFKQLKRWRLEHISLAADPQQPVLAE